MSYEIHYDRCAARLEIEGKEYFMFFLVSGSNNCFEISHSGREIPEKNIFALRRNDYTVPGNDVLGSSFLFSKEELDVLKKNLSSWTSDGVHRTRNTTISCEQFAQWVVGAANKAMSFADLLKADNTAYGYRYKGDEEQDYRIYINSEEQLIEALKASSETKIGIYLQGREIKRSIESYIDSRNSRRENRNKRSRGEVESFVIRFNDSYVYSIGARRMRYTSHPSSAKKYATKHSVKKAFFNVLGRFRGQYRVYHVFTNGQMRDITEAINS